MTDDQLILSLSSRKGFNEVKEYISDCDLDLERLMEINQNPNGYFVYSIARLMPRPVSQKFGKDFLEYIYSMYKIYYKNNTDKVRLHKSYNYYMDLTNLSGIEKALEIGLAQDSFFDLCWNFIKENASKYKYLDKSDLSYEKVTFYSFYKTVANSFYKLFQFKIPYERYPNKFMLKNFHAYQIVKNVDLIKLLYRNEPYADQFLLDAVDQINCQNFVYLLYDKNFNLQLLLEEDDPEQFLKKFSIYLKTVKNIANLNLLILNKFEEIFNFYINRFKDLLIADESAINKVRNSCVKILDGLNDSLYTYICLVTKTNPIKQSDNYNYVCFSEICSMYQILSEYDSSKSLGYLNIYLLLMKQMFLGEFNVPILFHLYIFQYLTREGLVRNYKAFITSKYNLLGENNGFNFLKIERCLANSSVLLNSYDMVYVIKYLLNQFDDDFLVLLWRKIKNSFKKYPYICNCIVTYINKVDPEYPIFTDDDFREIKLGIEWEKVCLKIAEKIYKNSELLYQHHLNNKKVPDICIKDHGIITTIIECKKSEYFVKKTYNNCARNEEYSLAETKEYLYYHPYCNNLVFWILKKDSKIKYTIPQNVSIYYADDLMNLKIGNNLKKQIRDLMKNERKNSDNLLQEWLESFQIDKLIDNYIVSLKI